MFTGVFTALVTPFNQDESIDEGALRALVEFQIEKGVSGLVPVGTTGESPTVTHDENIRIIEIVINQAAGRVPVCAGTGSNSTKEAVDMSQRARELGAAATLQVAPYYNKPNQEGLYRHFSTIADSVDLPQIVYNIPGRTGKNIETATVLRLAQHPNIQALKEASGSLPQMIDVLANKPNTLAVLSGDDNLALPLILMGGSGVVSVASNLAPAAIVGMVNSALEGHLEQARAAHYRLLPLFKAMFVDTNPIPVKYALHLMARVQHVYRLPLCPLAEDDKRKVEQVMRDLALA
ncbi:MAG: 4-hydroxy-tetrahydrodipicolinate synthase [Spirochaeta sp.]|nr:4-hydroxy-tetrahydrodipicolinate synthase [Spirochaeta sp.]